MFGAIGAIGENKAAEKARDKQYKYDSAVYNYNWEQTQKDYDFRVAENKVARANQDNNIRYQEASSLRDYQYNLAIRDFEFATQTRQFNQSERIYGLQTGFNNQAAQSAYEAENRRFQEVLTGMAFEQQDMLVKMLQQEGELQASGVSGRSAGKALSSALASYGRNQAIMAESLVSATRESDVTRRRIGLDKYSADLAAQSRRMLEPLKAPDPMPPLKMPRATISDPLMPDKPPPPVKGATGSAGARILGGVASDVNMGIGIASMIASFSDIRLKENIQQVGVSPSGISIFEWNYIGNDKRYRGVIAQYILDTHPEAIVELDGGYLGVDYSKIDVDMIALT